MTEYTSLPADLPIPPDDGAAAHLPGLPMPELRLPSSDGQSVDLGALGVGRTILYLYPRTGRPGEDLPPGWDDRLRPGDLPGRHALRAQPGRHHPPRPGPALHLRRRQHPVAAVPHADHPQPARRRGRHQARARPGHRPGHPVRRREDVDLPPARRHLLRGRHADHRRRRQVRHRAVLRPGAARRRALPARLARRRGRLPGAVQAARGHQGHRGAGSEDDRLQAEQARG